MNYIDGILDDQVIDQVIERGITPGSKVFTFTSR